MTPVGYVESTFEGSWQIVHVDTGMIFQRIGSGQWYEIRYAELGARLASNLDDDNYGRSPSLRKITWTPM